MCFVRGTFPARQIKWAIWIIFDAMPRAQQAPQSPAPRAFFWLEFSLRFVYIYFDTSRTDQLQIADGTWSFCVHIYSNLWTITIIKWPSLKANKTKKRARLFGRLRSFTTFCVAWERRGIVKRYSSRSISLPFSLLKVYFFPIGLDIWTLEEPSKFEILSQSTRIWVEPSPTLIVEKVLNEGASQGWFNTFSVEMKC